MNWKNLFPKYNIYYETNNGILYKGDCLEIMKEFPQEVFDAIITDPPYGTIKGINLDGYKKVDTSWDNRLCFITNSELRKYFEKVLNFIGKPLNEINRILEHRKAEHCFYINSVQFKLCKESIYKELIKVFSIDKMKGFRTYEDLKGLKEKYNKVFNLENKRYKTNVLYYKKDYSKEHPTQKPLNLIKYLIKTYSNERDLVLDFTSGSGTTLIACEELNRRWIGIEIEEKYCEIAKKRLKKIKNRLL